MLAFLVSAIEKNINTCQTREQSRKQTNKQKDKHISNKRTKQGKTKEYNIMMMMIMQTWMIMMIMLVMMSTRTMMMRGTITIMKRMGRRER